MARPHVFHVVFLRAEVDRADRKQRLDHWILGHCVHEVGERHSHPGVFTAKEFLSRELGDLLGLEEGNRIVDLEVSEQFLL